MGQEEVATLTPVEKHSLEEKGVSVGIAGEFQHFVYKGQIFHSMTYTRAAKSDTTVISTCDGEYFRIQRIFLVPDLGCTLLSIRSELTEAPLFPAHIKECFFSQVDV